MVGWIDYPRRSSSKKIRLFSERDRAVVLPQKEETMKKEAWFFILGILLAVSALNADAQPGADANAALSDDSKACLECHSGLNPGLVGDWKRSRHAVVSPGEALRKSLSERRISNESIPASLKSFAVGCAECHTMNADKHKDSFDHNGYRIHTVVSPTDCAACHPVEADQYGRNLMSHAYGNLQNNVVYRDLMNKVNGTEFFAGKRTDHVPPRAEDDADSCLSCHGTEVQAGDVKKRDTSMGEMEFPVLSGWPNQGVGRINPDGSKGACTACHARHQFSIELARNPHTCSECHKGPDVPAFSVYEVSKHGNIFSSAGKTWDLSSVPWKVGRDFTAPTCAACHVSLLTDAGAGGVIAERTHQMNDRLAWRLMGLVYAHPHPKSPDTSLIRNKAGLPLATELTGGLALDFLIDSVEQEKRKKTLQKVCLSCHTDRWVQGHFNRLEHTLTTTNALTLTATRILQTAWEKGYAKGLGQQDSIFNEAIEKKWVEQWLFYGNSTRFSSAMAGADYGVFANGRWQMHRNIQEMLDWLDIRQNAAKKGKK